MEIKIIENAGRVYRSQFILQQIPNWEWAKKMDAISGMTLVVETEHLFDNQFNTAPVPGVSNLGLRVDERYVSEVIKDERVDKVKCGYCGHQDFTTRICSKCGKTKYMKGLSKESSISLDYITRAYEEEKAGGEVDHNTGLGYVGLKLSDGSEYFFQGDDYDNIENDYNSVEWLSCSFEEYLLATSQNW